MLCECLSDTKVIVTSPMSSRNCSSTKGPPTGDEHRRFAMVRPGIQSYPAVTASIAKSVGPFNVAWMVILELHPRILTLDTERKGHVWLRTDFVPLQLILTDRARKIDTVWKCRDLGMFDYPTENVPYRVQGLISEPILPEQRMRY